MHITSRFPLAHPRPSSSLFLPVLLDLPSHPHNTNPNRLTLCVACSPQCANELSEACNRSDNRPSWLRSAWAVPRLGALDPTSSVPVGPALKAAVAVDQERFLREAATTAQQAVTPEDVVAAEEEGMPAYFLRLDKRSMRHVLLIKAANSLIYKWRSDHTFAGDVLHLYAMPE